MSNSAQKTATPLTDTASKFLTFDLHGGVYGIPILDVREIIALQPITPLPRMPAAVEGVINLRGRIIPVLDLRCSLNLDQGERDRSTCVVVLDIEANDQTSMHIGCIVDAVREVSSVHSSDVQDPPSVGTSMESDYILGLANPDGTDYVITLLDMRFVLAEFVNAIGLDTLSMLNEEVV